MAARTVIDPQVIVSHEFPQWSFTYSERDVSLYALGIGACLNDPVDDKELKYVYHRDVQPIEVLPTFAAIFPSQILSLMANSPGLEFDSHLLLHGKQDIEIYKPFPSSCCILNKAAIVGVHDKGKAALIEIEILCYEKESGVLLCRNLMTLYLRGAGGFSNSSQPYSYSKYPPSDKAVAAPKIPRTKPFAVYEECTQPSQALVYRLSGDYNPLHSDPTVAEIAGFSRPILHGLCSLGFAVRAIIKTICGGDHNMIKNISGRFLLHVFPGETLITEMWIEGGVRVMYETRVKERGGAAVVAGSVLLSQLKASL
ncbi:hypothetical protein M569_01352 [Genlisea aurea]|uniref:Uncharacterized protein n=1 Tax=Genlisea aurea TaxID=192259 RepID=S8ELB3_9LAMI|nr:hypothetical protein M569_01352 [Genlisea aurea]